MEDVPLKDAQDDGEGFPEANKDQGTTQKTQQPAGGLFQQVNELRKKKQTPETEEQIKYTDTIIGRLAGNKKFEALTFFFIGINSLYIGADADYSARTGKPSDLYDKDTPVGFKIMENVFCSYFTFEVIVRFIAYRRKRDCLFDGWFVFDGILVLFMVLETWIFPIFGVASALAQFSVMRLLRLLRISRMARLMKKVPELMIIIKGLIASFRSVGCTAILQVLILYVWAILFVSEYHEKEDLPQGATGEIEDDFGNMRKAMFSLFIMGTVLDDVTYLTNSIRRTKKYSMLFLFIVFIVISSFTILNMLIGILCEVVSATADSEKTKAAEDSVRDAITTLFNTMDQDGSGEISKEEFLHMRDSKTVCDALEELDIYDVHFQRYCEILFQDVEGKEDGKPSTIDFNTLITMILRLSPGNHINALDFSLLQASLDRSQEAIRERTKKIQAMINVAVNSTSRPGSQDSEKPRVPGMMQLPPNSLVDGVGPASGTEAREAAKADAPPSQPITSGEGGGEARGATSAVSSASSVREYTLDMFVRTSSHQIIEELERRFGVSALGDKTPNLGLDGQKDSRQPQTQEAFHSLGVPEH